MVKQAEIGFCTEVFQLAVDGFPGKTEGIVANRQAPRQQSELGLSLETVGLMRR